MLFKLQIFSLFILSSLYVVRVQSDPFDISIGSFFAPKVIKCYKCSSLRDEDCKNMTNAVSKEKLMEVCNGKAVGCVKQWIKREDGKTATYRDCYYGEISSLYTNFECKGITDRSYNVQRCYKCRDNLCNSSNHLSSMFSNMVFIATMAIIIKKFILKI